MLLCGIPSETPLAMVRDEVVALGAPVVVFNQRRFADAEIEFEVAGRRVAGRLRVDGRDHALEAFTGVYTRLMDDARLPELRDEHEGSALRAHCRELHQALYRWYEVAPARVVNRTAAMGSNCSKPYQAQLIRRHGFSVPETLVTNDPQLARAFAAEHGRVIYKSISGVRSIVQTLAADDLRRLERIRWCPTQFQAYVEGFDVRVHVVGAEVFATRITSDATDYRYAERQGNGRAALEPYDLDAATAERCVVLAADLGLTFAGIDLRMAVDGRVVCFEVNPSPAFSYYEAHTDQPIARAVAAHLAGGGPPFP